MVYKWKKKSKYNYQDNLKHGRYTTIIRMEKRKKRGFGSTETMKNMFILV